MSKSKANVLEDFIRNKVNAAISERVALELRSGRAETARILADFSQPLGWAIAAEIVHAPYGMLQLQDIMDWRFRRARGEN